MKQNREILQERVTERERERERERVGIISNSKSDLC